MLAADKLQLQTTLKQQATALKEKEFKLHHENLMTVGTQAAVLAGLDVTMLIELTPSPESDWNIDPQFWFVPRTIKFFYYITIVSAFCANILVVGQTTVLSVMGASLALRGPDGSMMTATDGLYDERASVFRAFGYGLASTLCSVILCVWLFLPPECALFCMICTVYTVEKMKRHYLRVQQKFLFKEEDTVDFRDLFDGPGNVRIPSVSQKTWKKEQSNSSRSGGGGSSSSKDRFSKQYSNTKNVVDIENNASFGNSARRRKTYKNDFDGNDDDYDYDADSIPLTRV